MVHRLQEWLADRTTLVQYPPMRRIAKLRWESYDTSPLIEVKGHRARLTWGATLLFGTAGLVMAVIALAGIALSLAVFYLVVVTVF